jgi:cytochrome c oxidase assembly protein subunit 15
MSESSVLSSKEEHNRWLAGYAFLTLAATLVLLYAGGFTTTIGAGMVFPDWPLSNGSLNPPGWTTDQAMLAEHGHRLIGLKVGILCIGLCIWMRLAEPRLWLRRLSYLALGFVIFQGLLGGARVLFVNTDLANIHGVTAQLFLCLLTCVAVGSSAWWKRLSTPETQEQRVYWKRLRWMGIAVCGLTIAQLVIGSILRHRGAGLAIPYFPHSAPDGSFTPMSWNWATQLNIAHRITALVLLIVLCLWVYRIVRAGWLGAVLKKLALWAFVLINLQIALGASIIWSARAPFQTTLHVLNGAIFLSIGCAITFSLFKPEIERKWEQCLK